MEINSTLTLLSDAGPAETNGLDVLSQIIGWTYFVLWSVSYYPQIYENWKGKSVVGYSFDLLALEFLDMTLYTVYNVGFYAFSSVEQEYFQWKGTTNNPVKLNDVVFGVHAIFCCFLLTLQCIFYERGDQKVSRTCRFVLLLTFLFVASTFGVSLAHSMKWFMWLSMIADVKIVLLLKYLPQIYLNSQRQSTEGFSIWLVLLDIAGGIFSIGQMFVDSGNKHDWTSFTGNPTKFLSGAVSVILDLVLIYQHYGRFRGKSGYIALPANNQPQSEDGSLKERQQEQV